MWQINELQSKPIEKELRKKGGDSALFSSKNDDLLPNKRCESWVNGALFKLHFTVRVGQF